MNIVTDNRSMTISIDSYEFPFHKTNTEDDNNWLNVKVEWEDEILKQEGIRPCLTTFELKQLYKDIQSLLDHKIDSYASDFIEPALQIKLQPYEDQYACFVSFLMPHMYDNPFVIVKKMEQKELEKALAQINKAMNDFPVRI